MDAKKEKTATTAESKAKRRSILSQKNTKKPISPRFLVALVILSQIQPGNTTANATVLSNNPALKEEYEKIKASNVK